VFIDPFLENCMYSRTIAFFVVTVASLTGCASTMKQEELEARTAQAVGRPVGQFSITDRSEETGGRINYTVNVRGGGAYRCYLYGATSFQKVMSFGQTPHSDAVCSAVSGSPGRSDNKPNAGERGRSGGAECSALMKAAGRC
jgi:hypothetical protein